MKIEMVLGQVGKNDDVPFDSPCPFLGQRVGGDFHGGGATTGIYDLSEQLLYIERLRGGTRRRNHALANFVLDRANQSGAQSRFFTNVLD